jgi:hypothetical protein
VIRRHRRQISSCWRKLNPGRQALLALAHLRKGETFADLAAAAAAYGRAVQLGVDLEAQPRRPRSPAWTRCG